MSRNDKTKNFGSTRNFRFSFLRHYAEVLNLTTLLFASLTGLNWEHTKLSKTSTWEVRFNNLWKFCGFGRFS